MSRLALVLALVGSLATTGHAERVTAVHSVAQPAESRAQPPDGRAEMDRDSVRKALLARREQNLAVFHQYQETGVFPSNVYQSGELNVWRDQDGHLCAAANLINASGANKLVEQTAHRSNFIKLGDVRSGPLMDWIMTSGFTQAEIALIQKPYRPVTVRPILRPKQPVAVDPAMKQRETERLLAVYKTVEKQLRDRTDQSLEAAVDTLMQRPRLAATVL
jgi:hypothetical protein